MELADWVEPGMGWSRAEVEVVVADYLKMLNLELAGQTYSKGRVPEWLRAQMLKVQLNPEEKESLKEYKTLHMTAIDPTENEVSQPERLQEVA